MRIPVIEGVIDRRILANYRVHPEVLAKLLPAPFRPKLIHGYGIAGICLIRLKQYCVPSCCPAAPVGRRVGRSSDGAPRSPCEW